MLRLQVAELQLKPLAAKANLSISYSTQRYGGQSSLAYMNGALVLVLHASATCRMRSSSLRCSHEGAPLLAIHKALDQGSSKGISSLRPRRSTLQVSAFSVFTIAQFLLFWLVELRPRRQTVQNIALQQETAHNRA
jgi:hypothetical protein